jgi:eukaryotic-like serine/threonine-protein kinase
MAGTRSHIEVATPASGAVDSQSGREFFQERLGIFGLCNCILSFGFIPLRIAGEIWLDPNQTILGLLAGPSMIVHLLASATTGVIWLITRRITMSSGVLQMLDAGVMVGVGTLYAAMGGMLTGGGSLIVNEPRVAMFTATLAVSQTVIFRAVAVPSPPRRTAILTSVSVMPLIAADIITLRGIAPGSASAVAPIFATAWAVLTVITCTVTSSVIYGLRREAQRGKRLGQYTLDEKIGEGAMGVVYRASHAMLRRPTAIKLLAAGRSGVVDLQRFEREVQLTATLTHPNTVAIYDYGRTPDGALYYAMEFLDGINLEDLVRRYGPQPAGRVIHILRQVCRALAEAHTLGLIHRDIKPANVILTTRGGEADFAKVVDFGLVKRIMSLPTDVTMTTDGQTVLAGTPLYFAPEAITSADNVDARSDLYSLGGVGYYLVTGQPLFEAKTIVALCAHHLNTTPISPSVRLGRPIDAVLEAVLMQTLAKTPAERPASALAVEEALSLSAAAKEWTIHDAERWWAANGAAVRQRSMPSVDASAVTVEVDLATR